MLKAILQRQKDDGKCTTGRFHIGYHAFHTIERPWLDNKPRISCIPAGKYRCVPHNWQESDKFRFKQVWRLENVPNRSAILIHSANLVGDVIGCIGVGTHIGKIGDETAVLNSRFAIQELRDTIGNNSFEIEIINP